MQNEPICPQVAKRGGALRFYAARSARELKNPPAAEFFSWSPDDAREAPFLYHPATMSVSSLRVVVTGGSGRIGSVLVRRLIEQGHAVTNVDRRPPDGAPAQAKFVFADLRQREILQPIFEQCDVVCHLGEIPNASGPLPPEQIFAHNTAVGSTVLQTAARNNPVTAIHAG